MGRTMPTGSVPPRHQWRAEDAIHRDVERNCREIADYLLQLARQGDVELALDALGRAIEGGMQELEGDARSRVENVVRALSQARSNQPEWRSRRDLIDPYFWG